MYSYAKGGDAMTEVEKIVDQMKRAFEGGAWHGPSVEELLAKVSATTAAAHPLPGRHSIWELVLHMAAWKDVVRRRLAGETVELSPEQNFPAVSHADEGAWTKAKDHLRESHRRLVAAVAASSDQRLDENVSGKNYIAYFLVHGIIQHDLYHAGQVAFLRNA
jgi:uncharacterized damage-inducible protein DinB